MTVPRIEMPDSPADQEPDAATDAAPDEQEQGQYAGLGPWLEKPDAWVFKDMDGEVKRQEPAAKNRFERAKRNAYWRRGAAFARLKGADKLEDRGVWKVWLPDGMSSMPPIPNKADDLCNKVSSQINVDPAVPECQPETDSDDHRSAAEFATRFLKANGGESGTNDARLTHRAVSAGCTRASAYKHPYINPVGGGWRPREIMAHPLAQQVGPDGQPIAPQGQPGPDGQPTPVPPADPIRRYVTPTQTITDNALEADRQWIPKLCVDLLFPEHVRLIPEACDGIADADGAIILDYCSFGELKALCKDVIEPMDIEKQRGLVAWKPVRHKDLLPRSLSAGTSDVTRSTTGTTPGDDDEIPDSVIVFFYRGYRKSIPSYPKGAYVIVSGANGGTVLYKKPWSAVVSTPEGTQKEECLDIPLSQYKQLEDDEAQDPHGLAIIERFGPGNEFRATIFGAVLEVVDKILHPHVFLAVTSPVQPKQLARRDDTPIPVTNVKEDAPFYEPPPEINPSLIDYVMERIDKDMDSASGLQETAQGTESADSQSGIAKRAVIEQSLVALGEIFQNTLTGDKRTWRLTLQLCRAFIQQPMRVSFVGEDGAYKEEEWTGSDFTGARDVSIAKGSGTMMAPSAKQELAFTLQKFAVLTPEEAADVVMSGVSPMLGIADNPHRNHVRGQIHTWKKGPPQGWTPPVTVVGPDGQQTMQGYSPFEARPTDEYPDVARIRYRELVKLGSTTAYTRWPVEWRAMYDQALKVAAYSAGVQTMREQFAAQQQQAAVAGQQAAQGAAAKQGADKEKTASTQAHQSAENDKDRAAQAQEGTANRQADVQQQAAAALAKQGGTVQQGAHHAVPA